jgi:CheY-like chemotaxis protein
LILVVDDNSDIRTLVSAQLETIGLSCHVAKDGKEAVDCVRRSYFDITFMDVSMPIMDGFESTLAIRAYQKSQDQSPSTIIGLTGQSNRVECIAMGMDDFMQKPVLLQELILKLKSYIHIGS